MSEYGKLHHISMMRNSERTAYPLPRNGFLIEKKILTELGQVFDGSSKIHSKISLNDIQYIRPTTSDSDEKILITNSIVRYLVQLTKENDKSFQINRNVLKYNKYNYTSAIWKG